MWPLFQDKPCVFFPLKKSLKIFYKYLLFQNKNFQIMDIFSTMQFSFNKSRHFESEQNTHTQTNTRTKKEQKITRNYLKLCWESKREKTCTNVNLFQANINEMCCKLAQHFHSLI